MNDIGTLIILVAIGLALSAVGAVYLRRGSNAGSWRLAAGVFATSILIGTVLYAILQATLDEGRVATAGALIVVFICAALVIYAERRESSARR